MPKDVIVVVDIDAKPAGTESLDILLVSTEGAKDVATYRDLEVIMTRGRPPWPTPSSVRLRS